MKITKISSSEKRPYIHAILNTYSKNYIQNSYEIHNVHAPNNPKYYQVFNNISFGSNAHFYAITKRTSKGTSVVIQIPTENEDRIKLEFSPQEAGIFLNENDIIDNKMVETFVEIYTKFYTVQKEKHEEESKLLKRIIQESSKNKVIVIDREIDNESLRTFKGVSENNFIEAYLSNIQDDLRRKEIAESFLEKNEKRYAKSIHSAGKTALYLMHLSKTNNGIDLSDFDKKAEIVTSIVGFGESCEGDYFKELIENSKDENGNFDIDLCHKISELLPTVYYSPTPKEDIENIAQRIECLKDKDPKNFEKSYEALLNMAEIGIIKLSLYSDNFNQFLNLFNPKTGVFEEQTIPLLIDFTDSCLDWYSDNVQEVDEENATECAEYIQTMANEYFSLIRDYQTGEIIENPLSIGDFFNAYT